VAAANGFPATVDEVVRFLLYEIPQDEQDAIANMTEDRLHGLHAGLGMWLRNSLRLWESRSELLVTTGATNPDDASAIIIVAFWKRLQADRPKLH
jgi:hypothetical protein